MYASAVTWLSKMFLPAPRIIDSSTILSNFWSSGSVVLARALQVCRASGVNSGTWLVVGKIPPLRSSWTKRSSPVNFFVVVGAAVVVGVASGAAESSDPHADKNITPRTMATATTYFTGESNQRNRDRGIGRVNVSANITRDADNCANESAGVRRAKPLPGTSNATDLSAACAPDRLAAVPAFQLPAGHCRYGRLISLVMAVLGDLLAQLDTDPVRRGSQFEHICQWFLRHDPVYAHELRRVWLWKDWPQRWGADAGIDLVAEDRRGRLWAIQAKAYDPAVSITKRDVDTFLAESGRPEFAFRLLIATTDLIGRTAKRTLEAQEKRASVLLRGDLEVATVDWPRSPTDLRSPRLVPNRPRPHQREALDKVIKGFDGYDRGQLIMACGTGKTLTALFINEQLAAERTLVLLPSLSLLAQTLREWTAHSTQAFDFLPVCSDATVADPDAVVANTSDLGFPVTTDPEEIARFLRRRSGPRVVFATYQSSPRSPTRSGWVGYLPSIWSSPTRRIAALAASPPVSAPSSTRSRSKRTVDCS